MTYTDWSEDLWSGLPQRTAIAFSLLPIEQPFIPGAIIGGKPLRSFHDLDNVDEKDLSPALRRLRDDPRGCSTRTGRPYPDALRQFRVTGVWGCRLRRIPSTPQDPWVAAIKAFLADKRIVTTVDIWLHGCPPAGRRHASRRIAPIMGFLGWRQWRTDWGAYWLAPGSATPKRRELQRPTCYADGKPRRALLPNQPVTGRRSPLHQLDLDRREAALAAWVEDQLACHDYVRA